MDSILLRMYAVADLEGGGRTGSAPTLALWVTD